MADVIRKVLVMFDAPMSILDGIQFFKFGEHTRRKAGINQIFCISSDRAGAIHFHAAPLPTTKAEDLLIKLVRKTLGPCRKCFPQIPVKDLFKRLSVPNFLVSRCLVNQRGDADNRKALNQRPAFLRNVNLFVGENASIERVNKDLASERKNFSLKPERDVGHVLCGALPEPNRG